MSKENIQQPSIDSKWTESKLVFVLFFLTPVISWLLLGWHFSYLPTEDYKILCYRLWALPTAVTFILFLLIKLTTFTLNKLNIKVTNLINGRHYVLGNIELVKLANASNVATKRSIYLLIYLKLIALTGAGWGTFGALIWFFLIQLHK